MKTTYNGQWSATVLIKKHTKVRRPLSRWMLYLDPVLDTGKFITKPVQDISIGLEDPLTIHKKVLLLQDEIVPPLRPVKPSIWQRFKRRVKR